ncbi:hypothetical protein [Paenibacillus sp. WC2504]|uniref:hypothetical protein n=1 Tax=Paenibacillus sp. WC2504 TaxID=3461403 RepID=UPI0040463DCF
MNIYLRSDVHKIVTGVSKNVIMLSSWHTFLSAMLSNELVAFRFLVYKMLDKISPTNVAYVYGDKKIKIKIKEG